ncbi:MAG: hypothetical protein J6U19_01985, partial [Oscillospiraceae bacterium]|nr:hypothetical protein [Oscillospiraceae bacterium]
MDTSAESSRLGDAMLKNACPQGLTSNFDSYIIHLTVRHLSSFFCYGGENARFRVQLRYCMYWHSAGGFHHQGL